MSEILAPKSPTQAGLDTIAEIADADGHTKDGAHPLRTLFQITPAGRLVWADR